MVAAFGRHLHFKSLEQALLDRHPEVADRVCFDDTSRLMHLKVTLSAGRSVALAQVRMGYSTVWCVMGPELDSEPSVWPLDTPDEVLVDALHAVASARITGEAVSTPWRWNESEPSDMTELADLLDAQGLRVRRVAAGNRWFASGPRHAAKLDIAGRDDGCFVEAEFPDAFVRVSLKPALGWLVDVYVPEVEAWGRVDLGWNLWGRTLPGAGGASCGRLGAGDRRRTGQGSEGLGPGGGRRAGRDGRTRLDGRPRRRSRRTRQGLHAGGRAALARSSAAHGEGSRPAHVTRLR
ncbi:hypothetical protein [Streptomyces sp. NPDC005336]|uniref:hypothetical protein n=1 Tax=Streptomyces sp. NPDC005336 TaxID=3157035 RepID=UPI0033B7E0CE